MPEQLEDLDDWAREHIETAVDLASEWFRKSDALSEDLFAGWIYSQLREPARNYLKSNQARSDDYRPDKALEYAKLRWASVLEGKISSAASETLRKDLDRIIGRLSKPARKNLRVLFMGDCLMAEVLTALTGPCAEAQISISPVQVHERVQVVLRSYIRTLDPSGFDLIFFSPFSHTFLPEYTQLLRWRAALWSRGKFFSFLDQFLEEVSLTIRALAKHFQCAIYVHNTAGTVQTFGTAAGVAKNIIALRNRKHLQSTINQRISRYVADPALEGRVRLLDENALRQNTSCWALGKVFFKGQMFHPTRLGLELGHRPYFDAVASAAFLANKKVVVCDLDNTLWDGVIGEGAVTHFLDRQQILKGLRDRGVLLSINSKNDPGNVHFSGAELQEADFVASRINWQPKVANMVSIRDELNLKVKDFIFIDDRADELERMQNAFPEIVTLDAQNVATWRWLAHWGAHMSTDQQEDRTKLYHERVAREQFIAGQPKPKDAHEDEAAALANLKLSVKIEEVGRSGLKRVAELINRTNQFNLCGSRTTVRELEVGLGSEHRILTATAKDKFGSMGVVGVMRVDRTPGGVEVPIFVLSCRVFGFGIEYALLNSLKGLASSDDALVGRYRETQYNQPCRQLYSRSGLTWDGTKWVGKIRDLPADLTWLTIEHCVSASFPALSAERR